MQSIEHMIAVLTDNPEVLGLLEYGSSSVGDARMLGDYDLLVFMNHKAPQVESLHFYVRGVPVDLNIRTLDEIRKMPRATGFDQVLLEGRIIHDPSGSLAQEMQRLRERQQQAPLEKTPDETFAITRHGAKHIFDKVRGRLDSDPTLCAFLLHQNVYWLIRNCFSVRNMEFKGEPYTLEFLQQHEPETYRLIERFYTAGNLQQQLELALSIAEAVLAPVGGMWRDDEVLTFGDQKAGREMFERLFHRGGTE